MEAIRSHTGEAETLFLLRASRKAAQLPNSVQKKKKKRGLSLNQCLNFPGERRQFEPSGNDYAPRLLGRAI